MDAYFSDRALALAPPVKRAAYSDRTAWLMAEISRLVYELLPCELNTQATVASIVAKIKAAVAKGDYEDVAMAVIEEARQRGAPTASIVETTLREANFELLDSFSIGGTQALLCRLNKTGACEGMLVLAFRGTQKSYDDIVSDIEADLVSAPLGGRIHRGFLDAYRLVETQIGASLQQYAGLPVYITGHSLGAALAVVATRYLDSDSTGATYTFGCPRAADDVFYESVKTPVYRVVNAADGVPRVPFGYGMMILLSLIQLIPVKGVTAVAKFIRQHFGGYTHYGDLVFLSAADNVVGDDGILFAKLDVRHSPNFFWVASQVLPRWIATRGKAVATDHYILEYSQKLLAYAQRRSRVSGQNPKVPETVPMRPPASAVSPVTAGDSPTPK